MAGRGTQCVAVSIFDGVRVGTQSQLAEGLAVCPLEGWTSSERQGGPTSPVRAIVEAILLRRRLAGPRSGGSICGILDVDLTGDAGFARGPVDSPAVLIRTISAKVCSSRSGALNDSVRNLSVRVDTAQHSGDLGVSRIGRESLVDAVLGVPGSV
jgi:hypothetical protein